MTSQPCAGKRTGAVSLVRAVEVPRRPAYRLEPVIGALRFGRVAGAADRLRRVLAGRAVWNVNSAAAVGGWPRCCRFWSGTGRIWASRSAG